METVHSYIYIVEFLDFYCIRVHAVGKCTSTAYYFVACCSKSTSERMSCFVTFFLSNQTVISYFILVILSSERRASIRIVSIVMPRKVNVVVGASTLIVLFPELMVFPMSNKSFL